MLKITQQPNGDSHVVTLEFSGDIYEMLRYAAVGEGWRPEQGSEDTTVNNAAAVKKAIINMFRHASNLAASVLSSEAAEVARRNAISKMQALQETMLNEGGN